MSSKALAWFRTLSAVCLLLPVVTRSSPGDVDRFFDTAFRVDQHVRILGVLDAGHVVYVGPIVERYGVLRHRFVPLRSDGRLDRVLDAELDNEPHPETWAQP